MALTTISTALKIPVSGVGWLGGQLAVSPAVLALGRVKIGASLTQSVALVNSGGSSVTVKQRNRHRPRLQNGRAQLSVDLVSGTEKNLLGHIHATVGGKRDRKYCGHQRCSELDRERARFGGAVGSGSLTSNPASLSFGSVQVSSPKTLAGTLTNSGGASITISQASVTGAGFVLSGLSLPVTLDAGQSVPFSVTFTPQASGTVTGSLAVVSTASNSMLTFPLLPPQRPAAC